MSLTIKSLKLFCILLILTFSFSKLSYAQSSLNTLNVQNSVMTDFDSEAISVSTVAKGFTSSKINPTVADKPAVFSQAQRATCQNTGAGVLNVITDGKTATNAIGQLVQPGDNFKVYGFTNISNLSIIRNASTDSTIYCTYSRLQ